MTSAPAEIKVQSQKQTSRAAMEVNTVAKYFTKARNLQPTNRLKY
jgi:hypothetical protein